MLCSSSFFFCLEDNEFGGGVYLILHRTFKSSQLSHISFKFASHYFVKLESKTRDMVSFCLIKNKFLTHRGSMKKLNKIIVGGIIGVSVFAGGVALAHGWSEEGHGHGNGEMFGHNSEMHQRANGTQSHRGQWKGENSAGMQQRGHGGGMSGGSEMMGMMGPGRLFRDEMQKARTEVLAELSGQTVEQIEQDTKSYSMRALLQKYDINFDRLESSMHAKMVLIVKNAADEGRITQNEANAIYSQMGTGPHGPKDKAGVNE